MFKQKTKNQSNQKPYVIYSDTLAGYLLMQHCKMLRIAPNIDDPLKDVYIFATTDKLLQCIEDYKTFRQK